MPTSSHRASYAAAVGAVGSGRRPRRTCPRPRSSRRAWSGPPRIDGKAIGQHHDPSSDLELGERHLVPGVFMRNRSPAPDARVYAQPLAPRRRRRATGWALVHLGNRPCRHGPPPGGSGGRAEPMPGRAWGAEQSPAKWRTTKDQGVTGPPANHPHRQRLWLRGAPRSVRPRGLRRRSRSPRLVHATCRPPTRPPGLRGTPEAAGPPAQQDAGA